MPTELAYNHDKRVAKLTRERLILLQACRTNPTLQRICMEKAAKDPIWWCNMFVVTFNPRVKPSKLPFILFPRQEELVTFLLDCYDKRTWNVCIKARYVGASYITTMLFLHKLIFEPDFTGTLSSNKAESVDKIGSINSLFEKIIQMYVLLPPWMKTFDLSANRKIRLIKNPLIGSSIVGESGDNIGRGGRSSWSVVDEAAFVERSEAVMAALSENTDCATLISTVNGMGNMFHRYATEDDKDGNPIMPRFYYRWTADPRRTLEWRSKQGQMHGERICKAELDCDFAANVEGQYIESEWIEAAVDSHKKIPELLPQPRERYTIDAGLDIGVTGDKTILTYREQSVVTHIHKLPPNEVTQTALIVNGKLNEDGVESLTYDADGIGRDISGTLDNLDESTDYIVERFHGAGTPSDFYWEELEKTSKELFYNKRAEAWGLLRWRLKNTYDHINGIQHHEPDEMISIPDDINLKADLGKPIMKYRKSKILIESKIEMKARGVSSPDYADSLAYCFYEGDSTSWFKNT